MRDEIDSCKFLHLRYLGEPEDNALRIVIEEAKADGLPQDFEIAPGQVIGDTRAIESDETCRTFELFWSSYVAYPVRNESFCALDDSEVLEGRLFCLILKSHFLDYVSRATFARDDHPGPLHHWGINCLNHTIDVISTGEPAISCPARA